MITLQLYINGELHAEKAFNRKQTPSAVKQAAKQLYSSHRFSIGNRPWFVCQVHKSKLNGNMANYELEATEAIALTQTRAA